MSGSQGFGGQGNSGFGQGFGSRPMQGWGGQYGQANSGQQYGQAHTGNSNQWQPDPGYSAQPQYSWSGQGDSGRNLMGGVPGGPGWNSPQPIEGFNPTPTNPGARTGRAAYGMPGWQGGDNGVY
jgi:hypothetical protein